MKFPKISILMIIMFCSFAQSSELMTKIKKQAEAHPKVTQAAKLLGIGAAVYYVGLQLFKALPSGKPTASVVQQTLPTFPIVKRDSEQSHCCASRLRIQLISEIQSHKHQKRKYCTEKKEDLPAHKPESNKFEVPNQEQITQCAQTFQESVAEYVQQVTAEQSNERERRDLFTDAAQSRVEIITPNTGILDCIRCEIMVAEMLKLGANIKSLQKSFKFKRQLLSKNKIRSQDADDYLRVTKFYETRREVLNNISRTLQMKIPVTRHRSSLWGKAPVQTPVDATPPTSVGALPDIPETLPFTPSQVAGDID